jgi:PAS domain S-box-containing protein
MDGRIPKQTQLRVLCLEDSTRDAEIIRESLNDAGFELDFKWTATEKEFRSLLSSQTYDVVLSDFRLPGFDAFGALRWSNEICPKIPFICVSGSIGEETAIELLKRGAVDYILKDRLSRLPFAVKRALEEAEEKEARRHAEEVLRESEEKYSAFVNYSLDAILLTSPDGRILSANPAACDMFGRPEDEICRLGREYLFDATDPRWVPALEERARTDRFRGELTFLRKDGTPFPCEVSSTVYLDRNGQQRMSMIIRDVTDRVRAQEQIKMSLREKEIMLKEIHHRVKNNMQVISSMLSLESQKTPDPHIRGLFGESINRIRTMALVHERLYKSGTLAAVGFKELLTAVASDLQRFYSVAGVACRVEAEDLALGIDTAIPCGMIVNELVSNAFKHAFLGRSSGHVLISLRRLEDGKLELSVEDAGVGFPPDSDFRTMSSIGMTLVNALTAQISGTIRLERNGGTRFVIIFPE